MSAPIPLPSATTLPTRTASSPIQAWRRAAGYTTAAAAVAGLCARYRLKPGKDGCPTVATWRAMEQSNGRLCSYQRLDRVARFLGVGCCLRLRTAWPVGYAPKNEPLPLRERVSLTARPATRRAVARVAPHRAQPERSGCTPTRRRGSGPALGTTPQARNHERKRGTGNSSTPDQAGT